MIIITSLLCFILFVYRRNNTKRNVSIVCTTDDFYTYFCIQCFTDDPKREVIHFTSLTCTNIDEGSYVHILLRSGVCHTRIINFAGEIKK